MSAEPLSREERENVLRAAQKSAEDRRLAWTALRIIEDLDATVRVAEAERDALARRVEALRQFVDRVAQDKWTVWQEPAKRALAADDEARR